MGRKRKVPASPVAKKAKVQTTGPTIEALFKRADLHQSNSNSASEWGNDGEVILDRANICGETDLDTMIELIDEWVMTEEELLDEDVSYICKFFIDLAGERNEQRIKQIVDHFYESVSKRASGREEWRTMYNDTIGLISADFENLNFDFF